MTPTHFKALVVSEQPDGSFTREVAERAVADLPASDLPGGDVLVRVSYSSLNYKDALSATGNKGVTRRFPHTPGIDAAGTLAEGHAGDLGPGDPVIVTGYDLGMNTAGGFGQYIRVPAGWVQPLPDGMTLRESMILGTAGLTAAMAVRRVTRDVAPDAGPVLVTGATGGVGSLACGLLAGLGYRVVAVSGKADAARMLEPLGVAEVIGRDEAGGPADRPLLKTRWAGAVDTVGGDMLAAVVKATAPLGVVACCGNVGGMDLPLNIFPFILRGVSLVGVDSQNCPADLRRDLWARLAGDWRLPQLDDLAREIPLEELEPAIDDILHGRIAGRTLVSLP
jgi:acrylyl-CoA reductase (NADPH)